QVELAAARTEVAILNTHVENALQFVELLENELPYIEAVEMYLDALQVRDSIAEVTAYMALARLADEHLPTPATPVEAPQIQAVPQRREHPVRTGYQSGRAPVSEGVHGRFRFRPGPSLPQSPRGRLGRRVRAAPPFLRASRHPATFRCCRRSRGGDRAPARERA